MIVTCKPELENESAWCDFLENADEELAGERLNEALSLAVAYQWHEETRNRLNALLEKGYDIYMRRFLCEWIPF